MERSRKHLKISSIVILIYAAATLLNLFAEIFFGELNSAEIPDGSPANILLITKIVLTVFSFIFLLPEIYVGLKGLKMAHNPDSSRFHILLAMILLGFTAVSMITPTVALFKGDSLGANLGDVLGMVVEIFIYYDYVKYARIVADEN